MVLFERLISSPDLTESPTGDEKTNFNENKKDSELIGIIELDGDAVNFERNLDITLDQELQKVLLIFCLSLNIKTVFLCRLGLKTTRPRTCKCETISCDFGTGETMQSILLKNFIQESELGIEKKYRAEERVFTLFCICYD